jgi:nucleoside-diphosphate-sugar epimerase
VGERQGAVEGLVVNDDVVRVLVTGARGFIGGPSVAALRARGMEVHAVSSRHQPDSNDGVTWHQGDLLDSGSAARLMDRVRPSHLLHLAWGMAPGAWSSPAGHLGWLRASLELIERFAEAGGTRVVVAGSCAEYDWSAGVCSEFSTPCVPATLYGASKLALGSVLGAFARDTRLSSASARIFFTYGPGEHPTRLVASIVRSLLREEAAACSHGRQVRDFLYVDDVAAALAALLDSGVTGPVNIGSGIPLAVADLALRVGECLGRPDLIRLGARASAVEEPPLVVADVARLRDEVGWVPRYSLDQGVSATTAWWRAQSAREVTAK